MTDREEIEIRMLLKEARRRREEVLKNPASFRGILFYEDDFLVDEIYNKYYAKSGNNELGGEEGGSFARF